ncbi:MAG: DUF4430 domain-containing protein [Thermoleophilaceae bacterium]|nr:DUF4430 domain-containing protein [Thermoleophilaceae bacterium]
MLLAGCGVGPGEEKDAGAQLRVTRDFGQELLAEAAADPIREGETVMRLLRSREKRVDTSYGGKFVKSIDGLGSTSSGGRKDWFYFVNGMEAGTGAAEREVEPNDVIQWDYREWEGAMRVPAIVGAFPEPMVNGFEGKKLPVRLECADAGEACDTAESRLGDAGVTASRSSLGSVAGAEVIRVVVGRFDRIRKAQAPSLLAEGPGRSGVFARFGRGGRRALELLDPQGELAREAPPGSGLVAVMALEQQGPVWMVTGADDAGVELAANALEENTLRDAFAVAATPDGPVKLPVR